MIMKGYNKQQEICKNKNKSKNKKFKVKMLK